MATTSGGGHHWKEAATVIIAARCKSCKPSNFNYKLLLLERTKKSKFMPDYYVFPGGKLDRADCSSDWLRILGMDGGPSPSATAYGHSQLASILRVQGPRPPIYTGNRYGSALPNELVLRICAVRETFEESGILLTQGSPVEFTPPDGREEWQQRVREDAANFLLLCRQLGCVPDLGALHEWSNWLTPTDFKIRFDTAFFVYCLDSLPNIQHDQQEISSFKWLSPSEMLAKYWSGNLMLPPPQFYELLRIFPLSDHSGLNAFAKERAHKGCRQFLPVRFAATDGVISCLPGDDLYPLQPDPMGGGEIEEVENTIESQRALSRRLHRFEYYAMFDSAVRCNVPLEFGHLAPAPLEKASFMKEIDSMVPKL